MVSMRVALRVFCLAASVVFASTACSNGADASVAGASDTHTTPNRQSSPLHAPTPEASGASSPDEPRTSAPSSASGGAGTDKASKGKASKGKAATDNASKGKAGSHKRHAARSGEAKSSTESVAAEHMPGDARGPNQTAVLEALPGATRAKCVAVGDRTDVRSGGIAAGDFAQARKEYRTELKKGHPEGVSVFMHVVPQRTGGMRGLTVKMQPLSSKGAPSTQRTKATNIANDWRYYSLDLKVPSPGKWRLVMESGGNKGCFDVTFAN